MNHDVVVVDIIKEVVASMTLTSNFEVGRSFDIQKGLLQKDQSITLKNTKYPLVALVMPFTERRGIQFYAKVTIDRIVIATITKETEPILKRYETGKTFKSVLYPRYYEFLRKLGAHSNILGQDPDSFVHTKIDLPGDEPIPQTNDYVDAILINNLELILLQTKTC